jgi:phosphatidylserine/phosphatidylglycerophosphate/cardiolipin synthase-like enzyme
VSKSLTSAGGLLVACLLAAGSTSGGATTRAAPIVPRDVVPTTVSTDVEVAHRALDPVQRELPPALARPDALTANVVGKAKVLSSGTRTVSKNVLRTGPIFNNPLGSVSSQQTISTQVSRLIAGAPKGAVIYVAMYHFSTQDTARQLVAAKKRGVNVRVVLDHDSTQYAAYKTLTKGIGTSKTKSSYVVTCGANRGCIGPEFNHNKFFLFSTTLQSKRVVVQTSANATYGARDLQWNDALTLKDSKVYLGYRKYFLDLAGQHATTDYHGQVQAGGYQLDFFPWASGDPITPALDSVSCDGGTRIRVMLGHFTYAPVAQRLWKLDDQGCQVQVFFSHVGKTVVKDLLKTGGRNGGPEARYLSEDGEAYAHSKYLLIDGGYEGTQQKVVFTGSANYTGIGFHGHDEAMLSVVDAKLEGQYVTNFTSMFKRGAGLKPGDAMLVPSNVVEPDWADDTSDSDN